ncbi:MAG: hypothetical protein D6721_04565 [Gammaproteobacteria bacterium]|nr:MAG: hypothetical protein D6721_04565 [Gammaproteobacteria bacterium]
MILYIGRLPAHVTSEALRATLSVPRHEPWRVRLCKRLQADGTLIRYALYRPAAPDTARKLLERGVVVVGEEAFGVREFQPRRVANERRRPLGQQAPWRGPERRIGDRRRGRPLSSAA